MMRLPITTSHKSATFRVGHALWGVLVGFLMIVPTNSFSFHIGVGLSNQTSGRMIPTIDAGILLGQTSLTVMSGGVQTSAYYHSFYNANLLFGFQKWGSGYLGDIWAGVGLGASYGEKNLNITNSASTADSEPQTADTDTMFGPAFRIESHPWGGSFFLGIDFNMGVGRAALLGGMGDSGHFTLGIRL